MSDTHEWPDLIGSGGQLNVSKTPRTDAEMVRIAMPNNRFPMMVPADFARQLEEELAAERELRIMQLAAISTATLQNTDRAIQDRIGTDNPYCSTAYLDTCEAVDREIRHREELAKMAEEREKWHDDHTRIQRELTAANKRLDDQAGYASDADRYQRELEVSKVTETAMTNEYCRLRAACEKLTDEWDEEAIADHDSPSGCARELRALLKGTP